jgi:hypothetical protein
MSQSQSWLGRLRAHTHWIESSVMADDDVRQRFASGEHPLQDHAVRNRRSALGREQRVRVLTPVDSD